MIYYIFVASTFNVQSVIGARGADGVWGAEGAEGATSKKLVSTITKIRLG